MEFKPGADFVYQQGLYNHKRQGTSPSVDNAPGLRLKSTAMGSEVCISMKPPEKL